MNAFTPGLFTITLPNQPRQYRKNGLQYAQQQKGAITITNQARGLAEHHRRDAIKRSLSSKETK